MYKNGLMPPGRPKKPPGESRDAVLTTRVTTADALRIKALADAEGISVADWLHVAARAAIESSGRSATAGSAGGASAACDG